MRSLKNICIIAGIQLASFSCSKNKDLTLAVPVSSVTVVNAIVNSNPLIVDLTGSDSVAVYYSTTQQVNFGSFYEYAIASARSVPLVVYQTTDTTHPVLKSNLNLLGNTVYSLFLSGTISNQISVDTLLVVDNPPYHAANDSTVGIRFINLSSGSNPVSINIQGSASGSEVSSLPYKSLTNFKNYSATSNTTQYTFEIRDITLDSLLTSYTYNVIPFKNITIAVMGQEGPSTSLPISAIQINNY